MAFKRKTSAALEQSVKRLTGVKKIVPAPALPAGLSVAETEQKQAALEALLVQYNGLLAQADMLGDQIGTAEKELRGLDSRLLTAIGLLYGKDSPEYEAAGGTRTSERKK